MINYINKFMVLWTDQRYLVAAIAFLIWLVSCGIAIKLGGLLIDRFVKKTNAKVNDIFFKELQVPLWFASVIIGFFVVSQTVGFPRRIVPYINRFTQLSISFLIIYFIARIIINLAKLGSKKNLGLKTAAPTFARIINIIIWGIGLLMLMDIFGISITPALASLGIAGLAIGLALQDTISNFFAGIYILMSQPVRVGDYIELENGLKGYVQNIGWRETRIKMLQNNTVIVPNSKLSQSILTNYYLPQTEMACLVQVGVSYDSDLEKVEKVTIEVGKQVQEKVNGGIKTFDPFIRYHTFDDFSINFTVILRINEFVDQYLVTHEFIKALHRRYKQEGIVIPFPIRTVEMKGKA